ncbi:hypothetical protein BDZ94DRAFT_1275272 [Collybia nuda]|uniref:Uncharacterized protein n=1 Tax=Collybia nuda TaxID=64659 RepID=A0A9P5XVR2_9AGAR|nr:hypothetical protein BDZ94DRAFT_1275272 [Collybia nuda]
MIKNRLVDDERLDGQVKLDSFGEAALEFGIAKTMFVPVKMTESSYYAPRHYYMTQESAVWIIQILFATSHHHQVSA